MSERWTLHETDGRHGPEFQIREGDRIIVTLRTGAIYGGQKADAERIVACVNACRGISISALDHGIITEIRDTRTVADRVPEIASRR